MLKAFIRNTLRIKETHLKEFKPHTLHLGYKEPHKRMKEKPVTGRKKYFETGNNEDYLT
jgi:hypothetical protein